MSKLDGTSLRGRLRKRLARNGDPDRGLATIEMVILLPVLFILMMMVIQFAMVWHGKHVAQAAAAEGVNAASGWHRTMTDGTSATERYLASVAPNLLASPQVSGGVAGQDVTITVTANIPTLVPFAQFTVTETATGPVEQFVVAP